MNLLIPLAGLLGIEIEALTDRLKTTIILNTVMILFCLAGVGFLIAAGFFALSEQLGPIYAALIFSGVFLVVAFAVYLGTRVGEGRRRKAAAEKRRSSETSAFLTTAALTALPALLRSPAIRTIGLPAAAIAAFMLVRNADKSDD